MKRQPPRDKRDKRGLTSEDRRIWGRVASSVTPSRPRKALRIGVDPADLDLLSEIIDAPVPGTGKGKAKTARSPRATPPKEAPPSQAAFLAALTGRPVKPPPAKLPGVPEDLEPNRKRRLSRERDPIEARIDLHGFSRFEAEDQLRAFLGSCQARGLRAVLVITGQGRLGGGVIRSSFEEWMQAPAMRLLVSGYSLAHQKHGGNGAFYVTLRRL